MNVSGEAAAAAVWAIFSDTVAEAPQQDVAEPPRLRAARNRRQACERFVSAAVNRGDMVAAERHAAKYHAAATEEDRLQQELIDAHPSPRC